MKKFMLLVLLTLTVTSCASMKPMDEYKERGLESSNRSLRLIYKGQLISEKDMVEVEDELISRNSKIGKEIRVKRELKAREDAWLLKEKEKKEKERKFREKVRKEKEARKKWMNSPEYKERQKLVRKRIKRCSDFVDEFEPAMEILMIDSLRGKVNQYFIVGLKGFRERNLICTFKHGKVYLNNM